MALRTGLPQHIVEELIELIPQEQRTPAEINAAIDSYISTHRKRSGRMRVTTIALMEMYQRDHRTLREIGVKVGLSPQSVAKRLRRAGIESSAGTWISRRCGFCGSDLRRTRGRARRSEKSYCNPRCYGAAWSSPSSFEWRHGTRLARAIVEKYFPLSSGMIVDHKDGDERNNDRVNLRVFANQSDHMRSHHGAKVPVLWDGSSVAL